MKPRLFVLFLIFAVLAGCGKKGPVRPLQKPLPAAPPEISLDQKGERLLLSWQIPERNQDGSPLRDLARFRIYRMEYDPAEECPECRDTSTLRREVDLEFLMDVVRRGDRLYFWDEAVRTGTGYIYRVAPVTESGHEGASAVARRPLFTPPQAPGKLFAQGLDKLVRLKWTQPPPSDADGELLGYNVYRASGEQPFVGAPINTQIVTSTEYEDFGLENAQVYRYAVRSVTRRGTLTVESAFSGSVSVVPRPGR